MHKVTGALPDAYWMALAKRGGGGPQRWFSQVHVSRRQAWSAPKFRGPPFNSQFLALAINAQSETDVTFNFSIQSVSLSSGMSDNQNELLDLTMTFEYC